MRTHHHRGPAALLLVCALALWDVTWGDLCGGGSSSNGHGNAVELGPAPPFDQAPTMSTGGNDAPRRRRRWKAEEASAGNADFDCRLKEELDAVKGVVDELQRTVEAQRAELRDLRRVLGASTESLSGDDDLSDLEGSPRELKASPTDESGSGSAPDAAEEEKLGTIRGGRSLGGGPAVVTLAAFNQLKGTVTALTNRMACVSSSSNSGDLYLVGCNLHVRNGAGTTDQVNGKGNLLVGYNAGSETLLRTGSHNIVVGDANDWTGYGALLVGYAHRSTAAYASAIGGQANEARGFGSVLVGGGYNVNSGYFGAMVGGQANQVAAGSFAAVAVGGQETTVLENGAVQVGGFRAEATVGQNDVGVANTRFAA
jgi:hypothetical protein